MQREDCKPDPVFTPYCPPLLRERDERDGGCHSSRRIVTDPLKQPTQKNIGPMYLFSIWPCFR